MLLRKLVLVLLAAGAVAGFVAATHAQPGAGTATPTSESSSGAPGPLLPRVRPQKPAHTTIGPGQSRERIDLKLQEGSGVRLRDGAFVSITAHDVTALAEVLSRSPGMRAERMFSRSEADLAADERRLEAKTGEDLADLNLWYRLLVAPGADPEAFIDALNSLDIVEIAYPEPLPAPPPTTPDFEWKQGYLDAAPGGIGAEVAWGLPGGTGAGVKIVDIEYSWNTAHEDLSRAPGALIPNGTPQDPYPEDNQNHGTAVLGEIVADRNGFGVTGIAYGASLGLVNAYRQVNDYALPEAIDLARTNTSAGDIILIEQQVQGPTAPCSQTDPYVPVEWWSAASDAIEVATADGRIVVEAAGNGGCNLDNPAYGNWFNRAYFDSGAIIVGAGAAPGCTAPPRSRLSFSSYGSRVDVQGWGECVVTSGYGYLQGGAKNVWYTDTFAGTSSASPIVAGAAAVVQGVRLARGFPKLAPLAMRNWLTANGTPQNMAVPGNIGPLPNLATADPGTPTPTATHTRTPTRTPTKTFTPTPTRTFTPTPTATGEAWPMFHHDLAHTGYATSPAPNTNQVLWNYTTGGRVWSSPAVANGRVYVGSEDKNVYGLDALTGARIWNYTTDSAVYYSSPAVAYGKVYVGTNGGRVYSLDASTGAYIWDYATGAQVFSSPAVANGNVYIGAHTGMVYCLDASTGALIWTSAKVGAVESSPAVADGRVYVGSWDGNVYALDASTGARIWNYTTGAQVFSSPAVANGIVYVGSWDGNVYALDASTGARIWNYPTGTHVYSSPAVADGKVYVGAYDRKVYCLDASSGTFIWSYPTGSILLSSPAVADGKVYIGSEDYNVYCLDASTGARIWSYGTGSYVYSSPAVADGRIYVGSSDGEVYAFGPPPDSDGDGCTDSEELAGAPAPKPGSTGAYDPMDPYDFYDLPVPAEPDMTPNGPKNRAVTIADVLAVLFYVGTSDGGSLNGNGVDYDSVKGSCDWNADTAPDKEGLCYDRSPSALPNPPWDAGPPDGAVSIQDVLAVVAQVGLDCSGPP
jgi:outer membrane protein assembly factor BamB